jgi:hypothetical protein
MLSEPSRVLSASVTGSPVGFVGGTPYTDDPDWFPVVITHIVPVTGPPAQVRYGFREQNLNYVTGAETDLHGGRRSDGTVWWGVSDRGYPFFVGEEAEAQRHPRFPQLYRLRSRAPYAVRFLRPTGPAVDGRYPANVERYNANTGVWSGFGGSVRLINPNGGPLPSDRNPPAGFLTNTRVPAVVQDRITSTGVPVFVAIIAPGLMTNWVCTNNTATITITGSV